MEEISRKRIAPILALDSPTYAEIDALLAKYRLACEALIFADLVVATARHTESRLWSVHGKINSKYRFHLAKFRNTEGRKRPVERRKLEKHYLGFIKASTRFYRAYVQRLASHFKTPKEVLRVAIKLHLNTLSVDAAVIPSQQETQIILESCHAALVRLGDLSRYRETELRTNDRNWAPALGYYDLATAINPSSGASHNQLAVIARTDGDHLKALYHLYRALSVPIPYPKALENLQTELKKILERGGKDQLHQPSRVFHGWFVYLHAKLHAAVNLSEHEELENEVLTYLSVELKERSLEGLLSKLTLSNIAAQHLADIDDAARIDAVRSHAFLSFLRFNLKTFFTLLRILLSELEEVFAEEDESSRIASARDISDRISATTRRILPCLRHYSSWLVSNAWQLVAIGNHEFVGVQVAEFWRIYANALTLLAATFEKSTSLEVDYLLEEDEDTIAFAPFHHTKTSARYFAGDGTTPKPRSCDQDVQRHHPSLEMLFRIRGLLEDGKSLAARQEDFAKHPTPLIPLIIDDDARFKFKEMGLPPEPSFRKVHSHTHSSASINREDIEHAKLKSRASRRLDNFAEDMPESIAPSASTSIAMHRMVDGLVASETSEKEEPSAHLLQMCYADSSFGPTQDHLENVQRPGLESNRSATGGYLTSQTENMAPTLPSIWNSPFAPRPGEPGSPHTRPSTAHKDATAGLAYVPSSITMMQEALLRQQRELEMQQSSMYELPTSLPPPTTSGKGGTLLGREATPIPTPFTSPAGKPSASLPISDMVRNASSQSARFGVIGETPPGGQGG